MDGFGAGRDLLAGALEAATEAVERRFRGDAQRKRRLDAGHSLVAHGEALLKVIGAVRAQAERDFDGADGQREKVAALRQLRRVALVARNLEHALGWLDDKPERLGLGATYLLREMACQIIAPDADLIEEPADSPSYATLSWPFERLLQEIGQEDLERVSHPVLVFFPRSEAGNAMLLPLVVHELGHPTWLRHKVGDALWATLQTSDAKDAVAKALQHPVRQQDEMVVELVRRLEELFCDALACALLGPSYLLAFTGWAAVMSLAEARDEHPPNLLRLELILRQLRDSGWEDALAEIPAVTEWLDGLLAQDLRLQKISKETLHALRAAHPHVVAAAQKAADGRVWTAPDYAAQKDRLIELLDDNLLPAQLDHDGTWADRRAILLACWTHTVAGNGPGTVAKVLNDRRYQAFVDKALEMSRVLEHWKAS